MCSTTRWEKSCSNRLDEVTSYQGLYLITACPLVDARRRALAFHSAFSDTRSLFHIRTPEDRAWNMEQRTGNAERKGDDLAERLRNRGRRRQCHRKAASIWP